MSTEIDAARLLVYRAAWLKQQGLPHTEEGAKAKLFASETARRRPARRSRSSAATATRRSSRSSATTATRDHRDLRGHERDPAARHRALDPRAPAARWRPASAARRCEPAVTLFLAGRRPELAQAHDELYPERVGEQIPLLVDARSTRLLRRDEARRAPTTCSDDSSHRAHPLSFDIARVRAVGGGGAVYGVPSPTEQLRATMRALWEPLPGVPALWRRARDPPPHMSLALDGGDDPSARLAARVERRPRRAAASALSRSAKPCSWRSTVDVWRAASDASVPSVERVGLTFHVDPRRR